MQLRYVGLLGVGVLVACATGTEPDRSGLVVDGSVSGSNTGGGAAFGSGGSSASGGTGGIGGSSGVGGSTGGGVGSAGASDGGGSGGSAGAQGGGGSGGSQGIGGANGSGGGSQGSGGSLCSGDAGPTAVDGGGTLRLDYRHDDCSPSDNAISPQLRIRNTGASPIPASELKVRYYYTIDVGSQTQQFNCDWSKIVGFDNACSKVTGSFTTITASKSDRYVEVSFTGTDSIAAGDFAELHLRLNKSDFAAFDEMNDYSYRASMTSWGEWEFVTLYRNGNLIWGIEP
jgi:Cellulose binding domain